MTMIVQLSRRQSKLINTIAHRNGFSDDFEVHTSPGSIKGDNYLGVITKVKIRNKERKLELILKSASTSEAFRKAAPIRKVFCREIYVYERILVEFEKFQDEFHIPNLFTGYPKLYGSSLEEEQECLVMENMLESGYKLWNRKIPMNAEHIKAVFLEYAKFHSISLAMAHKKPELFECLTKDIENHAFQDDFDDPEKMAVFSKSVIDTCSIALEDDPKMLVILKNFVNAIPEYLLKDLKDPGWNLLVNHGDSWCNNLMFKYEVLDNYGKISNVCILDWQIAKKGSPAADLTYFFLAHSPKEILYEYKNYLKLYHDTVCRNLRDFSCDPEEIFPYSLLEQHWRKFIGFGLYMSLVIIKMMYSDTDEAPDLVQRTESGEDIMSAFSFDLKNASGYNQRVKHLMEFVVDTGLI